MMFFSPARFRPLTLREMFAPRQAADYSESQAGLRGARLVLALLEPSTAAWREGQATFGVQSPSYSP
jgi:hypothetical protein